MPYLSVVVLGFRNFETVTRHCLDSLTPWLNHQEIEFLVVDNGSPDNSAELTRQWCEAHPTVRCLISEKNRGFAGGMNWACSYASAPWLLLVNNDTVFPEMALDALLRVLQKAPDSLAMLGPITNAAGNGQRLWKPGTSHAEWLQIGKVIHDSPTNQLMPTYRCDFFCIAIRKDVWLQLGGLDETFGLGYYEDFDFSLRVRNAGFEQMITEDVFVLHVGSASFKGSKEAHALIKKNKKILKHKHPLAKFEHTRIENLSILKRYLELQNLGLWTPALELRAGLRINAIHEDVPRSFIKRWIWKIKKRNMSI